MSEVPSTGDQSVGKDASLERFNKHQEFLQTPEYKERKLSLEFTAEELHLLIVNLEPWVEQIKSDIQAREANNEADISEDLKDDLDYDMRELEQLETLQEKLDSFYRAGWPDKTYHGWESKNEEPAH